MKKIDYFMRLAVMLIMAMTVCAVLPSCDNEEDGPNGGNSLDVYPWKEYPESYIRMFDSRMELNILSIRRDGTSLMMDYTLTNKGFGEDVKLKISLNSNGAHDNLGNTYQASVNWPGVTGSINGKNYYAIPRVEFLPNQTIRGDVQLLNFDINATAFSVSFDIQRDAPSNITLASNRMDFVNIPVED